MKLLRVGEPGKEKPALIDKDGNFRDLSSIIKDLNPDTLNFETIDNINKLEISSLSKLDTNLRIGACVSKPSKFIGIGLNFKDHAKEQNLPIPKEPIIFSKFTSCITGPNDPIIIPKKGDYFTINDSTNWRELLPIMLMEGHTARLSKDDNYFVFTLQDPNELWRRKENISVFDNYVIGGNNESGSLLTPWSRSIKDHYFNKYLIIDNKPVSEWKGYEVKQNYYWAMGDNRDDSLDSRYWGLIPENFILGEALFAYFSLDLKSWMPRLNRIGTIIR